MPRLELLFLSSEDVERLDLGPQEILDAVESGLRAHGEGEVVLPPKDHLSLEERYRGHFNILKGYVGPLDVAGVKVIGDYVDNYKHDLPSELALLTLYRARTGIPIAIVDATRITWMRTGAVSAVGAKYLARPGSKVLGHIGARGTAWYTVPLIDALFDLEEIRVTSRRAESRERYAERMSELIEKPVVAVDTVEEAANGADIVVDASRLATERVLLPNEVVKPGALVMPYGAVRSTDPGLPFLASKFVVDDWRQAAASEFGHYYRLIADGTLRREHVHAEIGEIVTGRRPGRESDDEIIVFWHRGFAISDIVLGQLAYARALAAGVGTLLVYAADTEGM
jgi:alanine dehydrogenase